MKEMIDKTTYERTLERLSKLPPVEDLSGNDRKFYLEIGRAILENELEYLIQQKKWVLGIIMSASMLDFVGKTRLIWKYKGSVSKKKINAFNFATTIMCLFASKIVDEQTYKKMEKIRDTRNKFAHNLARQFSISHKPNPDLENLIREAIEIIKSLFNSSNL